jgi:hypothetical protein
MEADMSLADDMVLPAPLTDIVMPPDEEPYAIVPLFGKYGEGLVAKVSLEDVVRVRKLKWYGSPTGYAVAYKVLPGNRFQQILMHRFVLGLEKHDGILVDHEKGDGLDNRRSKIRRADHQRNARNRQRRQAKQVVEYTGVHKQAHDKRWKAFITIDYEHLYLGGYDTPEEAARAYDACARYHFGEYAACNFEGTEAVNYEEMRSRANAIKHARITSAFMGVHWAKSEGKWKARITVDGTRHALGVYVTQVDAARAYDSAARYFLGEKARTNFEGIEAFSPIAVMQSNRQAAFERGERTTPYEGVYASKGKWACAITLDGKRRHIGYFVTQEVAARAVDDDLIRHGLEPINFPK